jgi:hypothetical protein
MSPFPNALVLVVAFYITGAVAAILLNSVEVAIGAQVAAQAAAITWLATRRPQGA